MFDRTANASQHVLGVFNDAVNQINSVSVYNKIYDEVMNTSASEFSDGWIAATVWIMEHPDSTIDENISAKLEVMHERYPYINDAKDDERP